MKTIVLDASAVVRFFTGDGPLPGGLEETVAKVDQGNASFLAPELIWVEVAQAFHRKRTRGQISPDEFNALWSEVIKMPIESFGHRELLEGAFDLAGKENLSVYDAVYLSLALRTGSSLSTADQRLEEAAIHCGAAEG